MANDMSACDWWICNTIWLCKTGLTLVEAVAHWSMVPIKPFPKSGPRLNIKTVLSTYGDFHVKDKTAVRTSYL